MASKDYNESGPFPAYNRTRLDRLVSWVVNAAKEATLAVIKGERSMPDRFGLIQARDRQTGELVDVVCMMRPHECRGASGPRHVCKQEPGDPSDVCPLAIMPHVANFEERYEPTGEDAEGRSVGAVCDFLSAARSEFESARKQAEALGADGIGRLVHEVMTDHQESDALQELTDLFAQIGEQKPKLLN